MKRRRDSSRDAEEEGERQRTRPRPHPTSPQVHHHRSRRTHQLVSRAPFLHGNFDPHPHWQPWAGGSLESHALEDSRVQALVANSVVSSILSSSGVKILDIGCGAGYFAAALLSAFPSIHSYTGVDIDGGLVARARRVVQWASTHTPSSTTATIANEALEAALRSRGLDPSKVPSSLRLCQGSHTRRHAAPPPPPSVNPSAVVMFRTEDFLSASPATPGVASATALTRGMERRRSSGGGGGGGGSGGGGNSGSGGGGNQHQYNHHHQQQQQHSTERGYATSVLSSAIRSGGGGGGGGGIPPPLPPPPFWDKDLPPLLPQFKRGQGGGGGGGGSAAAAASASASAAAAPAAPAPDALFSAHQPGTYSVIFALKVTKWVHLTRGDRGILLLFRRIYQLLAPGGVLILQPNAWEGYHKSERLLGGHAFTPGQSLSREVVSTEGGSGGGGRAEGGTTALGASSGSGGAAAASQSSSSSSSSSSSPSTHPPAPPPPPAPGTFKLRPDAFLVHLMGRVGFATLETTLWVKDKRGKPSPLYVLLKR